MEHISCAIHTAWKEPLFYGSCCCVSPKGTTEVNRPVLGLNICLCTFHVASLVKIGYGPTNYDRKYLFARSFFLFAAGSFNSPLVW